VKDEAIPEHIPVLSRTTSDDLTAPMRMIDVRCVRQDGPPDIDSYWDEDNTDVDVTVVWEGELSGTHLCRQK
jgi:hypothetical protein